METLLPNKFHHTHRKIMWLCAMRRDKLTSSRTISFTSSICCFGHSFIGLSSKYFCIITVLHDCVIKQQHPPPKAVTTSAQVMYYIWKLLLSVASPTFLSYIYIYINVLICKSLWIKASAEWLNILNKLINIFRKCFMQNANAKF